MSEIGDWLRRAAELVEAEARKLRDERDVLARLNVQLQVNYETANQNASGLRAERDALARKVEALSTLTDMLETERNALGRQVESLERKVEELKRDVSIRDQQYREAFDAWDKERDELSRKVAARTGG